MGSMIRLTAADGFEFGAWRAEPEAPAKGGIVVIQEIFGVNSHIRSVADGYARAGYLAIAPAIYDRVEPNVELGYVGDDVARGRDIRAACKLDQVMADLAAAADMAATAGKVGIVGYCWGGSLAYVAACRLGDKLAAAVGYYGGQITPHLDEAPGVPTMLHFGDQDTSIPLADVDRIRAARPEVEVFVYDGAGHGFNCEQRASYHEAHAQTALARSHALFAANVD